MCDVRISILSIFRDVRPSFLISRWSFYRRVRLFGPDGESMVLAGSSDRDFIAGVVEYGDGYAEYSPCPTEKVVRTRSAENQETERTWMR